MSTASRAFLLLTCFEPPLWCLRAEQRGSSGLCREPDLYPMFGLPMLPLGANLAAELVFAALFAVEAAAAAVAHGSAVYSDRLRLLRALCIVLILADVVYAYSTPLTWWRAAPYLRAILHLLHSQPLRAQLAVIQRAAKQFYSVVLLLLVLLVYAGWFATVVFPPTTAEGREVMPSVTEAVWQLLILLTTANFPDVIMPAYSSNRCAVLFFLAFVCLGVFLLMNYLLAVVYDACKTQDRLAQAAALDRRRSSLAAAFDLLDWDRPSSPPKAAHEGGVGAEHGLSRERVSLLLERLPHATSFRPPPPPRAGSKAKGAPRNEGAGIQMSLIYAVLDRSGDDLISLDEFYHLTTVLHLRFRRLDRRSLLERLADAPPSSILPSLGRLLGSVAFEYAVDAILVLSAVALALDPDVSHHGGLSLLQVGFTALFAVEVAAKCALLPWQAFISHGANLFDLIVTLASCVTLAAVYSPYGVDSGSAVRVVLSLRLLRLCRLLLYIPAFRVVIFTLVSLLPAASQLLFAFLWGIYLFSVLGMQLFGGIITRDTTGAIISPSQAAALAASQFGEAGYYPNNFNDLPSGAVTLFELLVVNNWQVITSGYVAVLGERARWFFILFYSLGVVVMLNILVAFVLDSYDAFAPAAARSLESTAYAGDSVRFDATKVTGTKTGVSGLFEVSLNDLPANLRDEWGKLLRKLFTIERTLSQPAPQSAAHRCGDDPWRDVISDLLMLMQ